MLRNNCGTEKSVSIKAARGRPRLFDREAALSQAMLLFWRKGFSATSLTDLTSAMGISPPSLYAAFGSKENLYAEALNYYQRIYTETLWAEFDNAPTARDAVTIYLMKTVQQFICAKETDYPLGCMLGLSAVGDEGNEILGKLVRDARKQTLERLESRLERAISEGELSVEKSVGLARFILAVQGGISLQARDGASHAELKAVAIRALSIWDHDRV